MNFFKLFLVIFTLIATTFCVFADNPLIEEEYYGDPPKRYLQVSSADSATDNFILQGTSAETLYSKLIRPGDQTWLQMFFHEDSCNTISDSTDITLHFTGYYKWGQGDYSNGINIDSLVYVDGDHPIIDSEARTPKAVKLDSAYVYDFVGINVIQTADTGDSISFRMGWIILNDK